MEFIQKVDVSRTFRHKELHLRAARAIEEINDLEGSLRSIKIEGLRNKNWKKNILKIIES